MYRYQLLVNVLLACLPGSAFAQEWHSVAPHGIVVENLASPQNESHLPTSPGEVIIWSNEESVIRQLETEYGTIYDSEITGFVNQQLAPKIPLVEQRYSSGRPVLYMDSPQSTEWSSLSAKSQPTWRPSTVQRSLRPGTVQRTLRPSTVQLTVMPRMTWSSERPSGLVPWLADLEQRKNLWLRRTFGR